MVIPVGPAGQGAVPLHRHWEGVDERPLPLPPLHPGRRPGQDLGRRAGQHGVQRPVARLPQRLLRPLLPHVPPPLLGPPDPLRLVAHPRLPRPRAARHPWREQAAAEAGAEGLEGRSGEGAQVLGRARAGGDPRRPAGQLHAAAALQDPAGGGVHGGPVLPLRLRLHAGQDRIRGLPLPLQDTVLHPAAHGEERLHRVHAGRVGVLVAPQRGGAVLPAGVEGQGGEEEEDELRRRRRRLRTAVVRGDALVE